MSEPCDPLNDAAALGRAKQSVWASELAHASADLISNLELHVISELRGDAVQEMHAPHRPSLSSSGPSAQIPRYRRGAHSLIQFCGETKTGRNRAEEQSLRPAPPLATLLSSQRTRPAKHRPLLAASRTQTPWVSLKTCNKGKLRQGDVCLSPWMVLSPCLLCSRDTVYDQISLRLHRLPFSLSPLQD